MSAPSEPEKYSIDEMMERLKKRPAEEPVHDGELVIRADGSQAVRVKKRKRRSRQPHKEVRQVNRRTRMLQVSAAFILLFLGVFAAGVAIVFANSAPFRLALVKNIAGCTGAAVDLREFRMNPTSANAGNLSMSWPAGNILRDLTLRDIRAEISPASFLGKSMVGEEVTAAEGTLTLRVPDAGKPVRETPAIKEALPIRFKRYAVTKFHLVLGDPAAPLIRLMNSEGSLLPDSSGGGTQMLLSRGDITISGWPKLQMDRSHIEFRGSDVDIVGMRIRHGSDTRGIFELNGTISPYATDSNPTLAVQFDAYQLSGIAGEELGRLFSGRIDTQPSAKSNNLSLAVATNPTSSMAVEFRNSLGSTFQINGFPFLSGLALVLDNSWFLKPVFENGTRGHLRRANGNVALNDLSFENKDYMALKGSVSMSPDKKLSGTLEVGVNDAMIQSAMIQSTRLRRLDGMFSPIEDGFRWISLKIGGTASAPTDDFKQLFDSAVAPKTANPVDKIPSFEDLTRPE